MNKLTHWIADKSYQTNSDFIVAVFNGTLTLPTAQRNEVWGRVTGKYSLEDLSSIKKQLIVLLLLICIGLGINYFLEPSSPLPTLFFLFFILAGSYFLYQNHKNRE